MTSPIPDLVGMVHLLALPGSPGFGGSMSQVSETALSDAEALVDAGFPALMIENFGDAPFFADDVPAETVAGLSVAISAITGLGVPVGVNILRNDALSALGVASVVGADFIRVNVLTGLMYTDQGPIVGRAAEVLRKRQTIAPDVEVWADVLVKHASPPAGIDAFQAALDTVERGLADAVIVSGSGTGATPNLDEARTIKKAVPESRLVIGSGAKPENLSELTEIADAVIVGSSIKIDGDARNRPDPRRVAAFVQSATDCGLI